MCLGDSMLPDIFAHRRSFAGVLALPPLQIVQVAAELDGRSVRNGDGQPLLKAFPAFVANPGLNMIRFDGPVPGDAAIPVFIQTGRIDWANRFAGARVPVLAICPMVRGKRHGADPAIGRLVLIGLGIPPDAPVAAGVSPRSPIILPPVGNPWRAPSRRSIQLPR